MRTLKSNTTFLDTFWVSLAILFSGAGPGEQGWRPRAGRPHDRDAADLGRSVSSPPGKMRRGAFSGGGLQSSVACDRPGGLRPSQSFVANSNSLVCHFALPTCRRGILPATHLNFLQGDFRI